VGAVQIGDFKYNDGATEGFFVYCFCFCFFSSKINVFSYLNSAGFFENFHRYFQYYYCCFQ
jgi:hypothetical protein